MTSSLVGSEMCIRDRCGWTGSRRVLELLRHLRRRSGLTSDSSCPGQQRSCLLYTSDAADDM
eukprot:5289724-Prorocentrum_lima.AAC.1